MNKRLKKTILIGVGVFSTMFLYTILTTKSTPSIGEFEDIRDNYDDKEFYDLTHNTDGSSNEYGDSCL